MRHARKTCKDCGEVLTLRHFYRHASYADGHMNTCKRCKIAAVRENEELKEEQYRALKKRISARPHAVARRAEYNRSERGRLVHRVACARYVRIKRLFEATA